MNDLFNKLLILRTPGIGPVKYADLVKKYGGVAAAVDAMNIDMARRDAVMREMERAMRIGVQYICDDASGYPRALRAVKNHPPVICARGNIDTLLRPVVSMVGTRHATAAGMGFMSDMAAAFASHGIAVASGLAIGTDTAAHMGALRTDGNAQTIAVLAGGVDYVWPPENQRLYDQILERGVVISEMPVGFVPIGTNFVQRNRWVAGIGDILILGEADKNSGSMTTARFAMEFGREIWAVPSHPSDSRGDGPNSLIRAGHAKLCLGVTDFFGGDEKKTQKKKNDENLSSQEILLDRLGIIPLSESVLAQIVKKSVSEIKRDLVILEMRGLVRKCDGGYVRT